MYPSSSSYTWYLEAFGGIRVQAYSVVLLCLPLNTFFEDTFPKTQFGQGGV